MQVYVGGDHHTSTRIWLGQVGFGQMKSPIGWQPPFRDTPWVLDNGAFSLFRRGGGRYDSDMGKAFTRLLERCEAGLYRLPDFAIIPDIVASRSSLALSLRWMGRIPACIPAYLAVQNGMTVKRVEAVVRDHPGTVHGLFVGGTIDWKDATAPAWAALAHEYGLKCHVGRVGMAERICAMLEAGADSIDSTSWARHRSHWHIRDGFRLFANRSGTVPKELALLERWPAPAS